MTTITVENADRSVPIGNRIGVAHTSMRRLVGLLGRTGLSPGEGLWIKPSSGVHTFGMCFPIDVIGLDQHFTIVKLWRSLPPYRVTSVHWKVRSVLELRAGTIDIANTKIGDRLRFIHEDSPGVSL